MTFEVIALNSARILVLFSIATGLISISYIIYRLLEARASHKISKSDKPLIVSALSGVMLASVAIIFVAAEYRDTQVERKQLIYQLEGISKDIDSEIKSSVASRVSYFHTHAMIERAIDTCLTLAKENDGKPSSACSRTITGN